MTDMCRNSRRRAAFTLMEILLVIALIAVLAAISAWAAVSVIGGRTYNNTENTIKVVNKMLQDRWSAVILAANKETPSDAVKALAAPDPTGARAKAIWVKVRLCEAFPVSFKELNPGDPTTIVNTYIVSTPSNPVSLKPYFIKYRTQITSYPAIPGPTESSACLLMALTGLQTSGAPVDEQLKYAVADTNGDGIAELVDGWNRPLAFFRFPWNNADLQTSNPATANSPAAKFADPVDNTGTLINLTWCNSLSRNTFEAAFHSVSWPNYAPFPVAIGVAQQSMKASNSIPVIVSAGKDGKFGLHHVSGANSAVDQQMMVTANSPNAIDNIYSYKLK